MSEYNPRRPYIDDEPDGYEEGDRDYLDNNNDLAVRLLDAYGSEEGMRRFLVGMLLAHPSMMTLAAQIINDPENPRWRE